MIITAEWLQQNGACQEGVKYYNQRGITDLKTMLTVRADHQYYVWMNWLLLYCFTGSVLSQYLTRVYGVDNSGVWPLGRLSSWTEHALKRRHRIMGPKCIAVGLQLIQENNL